MCDVTSHPVYQTHCTQYQPWVPYQRGMVLMFWYQGVGLGQRRITAATTTLPVRSRAHISAAFLGFRVQTGCQCASVASFSFPLCSVCFHLGTRSCAHDAHVSDLLSPVLKCVRSMLATSCLALIPADVYLLCGCNADTHGHRVCVCSARLCPTGSVAR